MISKRRCPRTGVVNFFIAVEPLIAVGSITKRGAPDHYDWHCYLDEPVNGTALDITIAEAELNDAIARRRHRPVSIV